MGVWKMEQAFAPGYDPALDLASHSHRENPDWHNEGHLRRREQVPAVPFSNAFE